MRITEIKGTSIDWRELTINGQAYICRSYSSKKIILSYHFRAEVDFTI